MNKAHERAKSGLKVLINELAKNINYWEISSLTYYQKLKIQWIIILNRKNKGIKENLLSLKESYRLITEW